MAIMPRPLGGPLIEEAVRGLRESGVDVLVSMLEDHEVEALQLTGEAEACQKEGISFLSHPIPDHDVPVDEAEAVRFIRSLGERFQEGKRIVVHCYAGIGRSATIAACTLLTSGMGLETVLERMAVARGFPVPETEAQRAWVERFADVYALGG